MTRYIISIAILFMLIGLAGMASATMWLYTDPTFFTMGAQSNTANYQFSYVGSNFGSNEIGTFKPANMTPFEIINAPFFPLLSGGFGITPTQSQNTARPVELGSTGSLDSTPPQLSFSGGMEDNLRYAQSKSSIKVGQGGSWTNLDNPWLV
jgi:hypothetical protein